MAGPRDDGRGGRRRKSDRDGRRAVARIRSGERVGVVVEVRGVAADAIDRAVEAREIARDLRVVDSGSADVRVERDRVQIGGRYTPGNTRARIRSSVSAVIGGQIVESVLSALR